MPPRRRRARRRRPRCRPPGGPDPAEREAVGRRGGRRRGDWASRARRQEQAGVPSVDAELVVAAAEESPRAQEADGRSPSGSGLLRDAQRHPQAERTGLVAGGGADLSTGLGAAARPDVERSEPARFEAGSGVASGGRGEERRLGEQVMGASALAATSTRASRTPSRDCRSRRPGTKGMTRSGCALRWSTARLRWWSPCRRRR